MNEYVYYLWFLYSVIGQSFDAFMFAFLCLSCCFMIRLDQAKQLVVFCLTFRLRASAFALCCIMCFTMLLSLMFFG